MLRGDILLVSSNVFVRQGLVQVLAKDSLSVVGQEGSLEAALSLLQSGNLQVDLLIADIDGGGNPACLKAIADRHPEVSIVMLAADPNQLVYQQATEVRAKALLPSFISAEALNLTLQLVMLGENLFLSTRDASGEVKPADPAPQRSEDVRHLSPREAEVLELIQKGASNKAIARELDLAEATVKVHVKTMLRKIDVQNRTQAAIWAINHPKGTRSRLPRNPRVDRLSSAVSPPL